MLANLTCLLGQSFDFENGTSHISLCRRKIQKWKEIIRKKVKEEGRKEEIRRYK
jgi:hypothetical protein